jgi:hypothetical protein
MDEGLAEYIFPLKLGAKASRTLDDFTVAVKIKSNAGIASVYSPTHEVGVSKKSDHEAVAGMESKGALLDRDFQLFYTVGEKDFGLSLMTYRPDQDPKVWWFKPRFSLIAIKRDISGESGDMLYSVIPLNYALMEAMKNDTKPVFKGVTKVNGRDAYSVEFTLPKSKMKPQDTVYRKSGINPSYRKRFVVN